jgi:hypothetical protein
MANILYKGPIGKEDLQLEGDELLNSGSYTRRGSLGTVTMTKIPDFIKTHVSTINARYFNGGVLTEATIIAAIGSIGTLPRTLYLEPGTWAIGNDLTIPSNVVLCPDNGAILTVATAKTLTINGPFEAGPYQVFSLAGTGSVAGLKNTDPRWFGAVTDGTDQTTIVDAALKATVAGGVITIPGGMRWDYDTIKADHPNDVVIIDQSGYDWQQDQANSAQVRYILNTANPGSKNAHHFVVASDYHPAMVLDNLTPYSAGGDPQPQVSTHYRLRNLAGTEIGWQTIAEFYNGNPLWALKNNTVVPYEAVIEVLGVAGSPIGIRQTPSAGITLGMTDPIDEVMTISLTSYAAKDIMLGLTHGTTQAWRIYSHAADGSLEFESRTSPNRSFIIYPNGTYKWGAGMTVYQGAASGAGKPSTAVRGDLYYYTDPSASGFVGEVCTAAGTPGTWKTFGAISAP